MRLPHRWLKIILSLGSIMILWLCFQVWQINQEFFIQASSSSHQLITIPKATSAKQLTRIFYQQGIIHSPNLLLFLLKYNALSHQLKSGTYLFNSNESVWSLIEKIQKGQVYQTHLQIIEGTRLCDLIKKLKASPFYQFDETMLDQLQYKAGSLEGLLFPSTYTQAYGESVLPVLKLAQNTMQQKLTEVWNTRDLNLPYQSPYELLIAASIIEKESAIEEERRLISGIIINRLKLGMPLQMDPTVAYGVNSCEHILLKGKDTQLDTPFNTYQHKGLPPTPIAMVSLSALQAAAHPRLSSFIYFVAKGDGSHYFSVDYQQQKQAIKKYLRATNAN